MRLSIRESVTTIDLYDVSGDVRTLKVNWDYMPNTSDIKDGELDLDSPEGKRKAKNEEKEFGRACENSTRIINALILRKTRQVREAASKEIAERVVSELKSMVSLDSGIAILAENIRKPKIKTVQELCSEGGHRQYRDLTAEEIMLLSLLDRPERAYDVTSDSTYRKAWRVFYDTTTGQAGVIYYFSKDSGLDSFNRTAGVRTLKVLFKREVMQKFRSISDPKGSTIINFDAYLDDTAYNGKFEELIIGVSDDKKGAQRLASNGVTKKKMRNKWIFLGNSGGGMIWYGVLTRMSKYLEKIPAIFSDDREFKGYAVFFDNHLLIYDEKGVLAEKVKTTYDFNNEFTRVDEAPELLEEEGTDDIEDMRKAGELDDYLREQKAQSDLLDPLIKVLEHIDIAASQIREERNLTPREVYIRKIKDELGIDLSDGFKRVQTTGLEKSHVVFFDPALGYRFPEYYRAIYLIFSYIPRDLRPVIKYWMGDFPAEALFARFEVDSNMGEGNRREYLYSYLGPRLECYDLPEKYPTEWSERQNDPWLWFSKITFPSRDDKTGFKGILLTTLVFDGKTLCAVFKKEDREKYLLSILQSLLARVWINISRGRNNYIGSRFIDVISQYPSLFNESMAMFNVFTQSTFPLFSFEDLLRQNASIETIDSKPHLFALLFGKLYSLYLMDPAKLQEYPKIAEYFSWLEKQKIAARSLNEEAEKPAKVSAAGSSSTEGNTPMVKWDKAFAFENAKSNPFWFVYFGPGEWKDFGITEYFRKNYSQKKLEELIIKWLRNIKDSSRPFYAGYSILCLIKLFSRDKRRQFILSHREEMRVLFNELIHRENSSYKIPEEGLLDTEKEITSLFSDEELAGLIDDFVFSLNDVVIYLINNPKKRKKILGALKNKVVRNVVELNIALIEAAKDSEAIKITVDDYGGMNVPGKGKSRSKSAGDRAIPLLGNRESRHVLYKLSPIFALAEAVLFNNLIFNAFMALDNIQTALFELGLLAETPQEEAVVSGPFVGIRTKERQRFTSFFEKYRLARIIYDIYRKDQAVLFMDDLISGRLGLGILRILSDYEIANMFEITLRDIKRLMYENWLQDLADQFGVSVFEIESKVKEKTYQELADKLGISAADLKLLLVDKRYERVKALRQSIGDDSRLSMMADARKFYLRDRVRDIRRAYIPLSANVEAQAILALKELQLDDGTKDTELPDVLSIRNACKILGVKLEDDIGSVREVYRKLAFIFHPDRDESKKYPGVFQLISKAYEILERYSTLKKK